MAGFSASNAAVTCSAFSAEQVKRICLGGSGASGSAAASSTRRTWGSRPCRSSSFCQGLIRRRNQSCSSRCFSPSSASRRRPLMTLAGSIRPSSSSARNCSTVNTVPPVLLSRSRSSSAVRARLRAVSGTGPCAHTFIRPLLLWQATASDTGLPACTRMARDTGIFRFSRPFSYCARASANSSLGSGAFSGRVPNI